MLMGVGFICERTKLLNESVIKGLIELLVLIVTPCLIVHAFERPFEAHLMAGLGWAAAAAIFAHILGIVAGFICFKNKECSARTSVLRFAVIFSNAGFMGIPLEYALLGNEGVFFGAVYVAIFNLLCWSYGLVVMCGSLKDLKLRPIIINPGTVGIVLGLPLFLFSYRLPSVIGTPVSMLADLNTPLAMIVIGYYLSKASFASVLKCASAYMATFLRLIVIPLCLLGTLVMFRNTLNGTMAVAIVTAASAPVAALTTMLAACYEKDVQISVGLVAGTTLLSIFTMPPIVGLAMRIFGK